MNRGSERASMKYEPGKYEEGRVKVKVRGRLAQ
jgi:hypothetical protein